MLLLTERRDLQEVVPFEHLAAHGPGSLSLRDTVYP